MDTGKIRSFAVAARERLIAGVDERLDALGFAADGSVPEGNRPVKVEGGVKFRGAVLPDPSFFGKWTRLESEIRHHDQHRRADQKTGREMVRDAAAYTWFNRLCAIRILEKRGFVPPVLAYAGSTDARTPALVAAMRAGEPQNHLSSDARARLDRIRFDDAKTTEQFAILVTAFCRANRVLHACFGSVLDYTDLLLPRDVLAPGGFVDALNDPDVISDDDWRRDELVGWLYQHYVSNRKQEVFDSFKAGKKAEAEDIPAATEIFTPNWIVKYMVENSLGRLAVENGLGGDFVTDWRYLVREGDGAAAPSLRVDSPEGLTFADLACGSGHILLEGFRLLMKVYAEAGYSRRQAIGRIFSENLLGIDLDPRARQLSQFALLLAAMDADPSFADAHVLPRVLDMEGTLGEGEYSRAEMGEVLSVQEDAVLDELCGAFALLAEAHNLGSLMKFGISERTRGVLAARVGELERAAAPEGLFSLSAKYLPSFRLILALTAHYAAITMNPPYMGAGNMNERLKKYLETNYKDGKNDLMTAFMMVADEHVQEGGRWAMINLPSWMFISSFENLRRNLVEKEQIASLVHNGRGVFGSDFGSVTFVIEKTKPCRKGLYRRLFKEHVQVRSPEAIHQLYLDPSYGRYEADQRSFAKIPGSPVAYWVGEKMIKAFEGDLINDGAYTVNGFTTGKNELFLRLWFEVSINKIGFTIPSLEAAKSSKLKWFPYNKGGEYRKWYGNNDFVVNWYNDGKDIKEFGHLVPRSLKFQFKEAVSWSKISAGLPAFRIKSTGTMFDVAGLSLISKGQINNVLYLSLLNSVVAQRCLEFLSPTMNFETGHVAAIPFRIQDSSQIEKNVADLIALSRADWDEHETSWDFKVNPLVANGRGRTVEAAYRELAETWRARTQRMKDLEEENNRLFIDAYGLQDELSPKVPLNRISLTCNPWYRYGVKEEENGKSCRVDSSAALEARLRTDTVKELVSYAVGCLMGRYSLEVAKEVASDKCLVAREGVVTNHYPLATSHYPLATILPVMAGETAFSDNAPDRVKEFIKAAFGEAHLTDNLNFIEAALGTSLEAYLAKDFWNDHKRTYRNRPIYWLFRSKKGAFQALAYLHRMDAYTASKVRNGYLLPHIEFLRGRIAAESARGAELTAAERTRLKKMQQALAECLEYDGRLHVVADRMQAIDLDDGVVVNYAKFGDVLARIK